MNTNRLEISPMSKEDLRCFMLEYAVKQGWNYSEEDVDAYYTINAAGFNLLKINNQLAGCILVTKYGFEKAENSLLSVGFFLVKEEYRGQGLAGTELWEKSIAKHLKTYLCCLSTVPRAISFYQKRGLFKTSITNSHYKNNMIEYEPEKSSVLRELINLGVIQQLSRKGDFEAIESYESELFGKNSNLLERIQFRNTWLKRPDAITMLYLNSGKLEGYGVATICKREKNENNSSHKTVYRLSPVYANTADIASKILAGILNQITKRQGKSVELYAPIGNPILLDIFKNYGLQKIEDGDTYLMVNVKPELFNKPQLEKIVALTPLEYPHEAVMGLSTTK